MTIKIHYTEDDLAKLRKEIYLTALAKKKIYIEELNKNKYKDLVKAFARLSIVCIFISFAGVFLFNFLSCWLINGSGSYSLDPVYAEKILPGLTILSILVSLIISIALTNSFIIEKMSDYISWLDNSIEYYENYVTQENNLDPADFIACKNFQRINEMSKLLSVKKYILECTLTDDSLFIAYDAIDHLQMDSIGFDRVMKRNDTEITALDIFLSGDQLVAIVPPSS